MALQDLVFLLLLVLLDVGSSETLVALASKSLNVERVQFGCVYSKETLGRGTVIEVIDIPFV